MRTLEAVDLDLKTLGRPVHPCAGGLQRPAARTNAITQPATAWRHALLHWRAARDAWRASNPEGEERYALLLEEREAIELETVRRQRRRVTSGLPKRLADALVVLKPTDAMRGAEAWLASERHWLVLGGSVGVGKSVAAAWALEQSPGATAWVTSAGFATLVGGFSGQAECERLKHVDVLCVDDYGTEHLSSFAEAVFHEVLAARHEDALRTVMTHNLSREDFRRRLGSRLADRIATDCVYVECAGASLRRAS